MDRVQTAVLDRARGGDDRLAQHLASEHVPARAALGAKQVHLDALHLEQLEQRAEGLGRFGGRVVHDRRCYPGTTVTFTASAVLSAATAKAAPTSSRAKRWLRRRAKSSGCAARSSMAAAKSGVRPGRRA